MKCYFFLWSSWLLKVHASSSFFFYCYFGGDGVYRGDAVSNYTFSPLYNNNLQMSIRQEAAIAVELDKITQEVLQACFACYRYVGNGNIWSFSLALTVQNGGEQQENCRRRTATVVVVSYPKRKYDINNGQGRLLFMLGNIIFNEEYEMTLLKCNNA